MKAVSKVMLGLGGFLAMVSTITMASNAPVVASYTYDVSKDFATHDTITSSISSDGEMTIHSEGSSGDTTIHVTLNPSNKARVLRSISNVSYASPVVKTRAVICMMIVAPVASGPKSLSVVGRFDSFSGTIGSPLRTVLTPEHCYVRQWTTLDNPYSIQDANYLEGMIEALSNAALDLN
jgi:hypothetical protein